jgi:LysM repeat protein
MADSASAIIHVVRKNETLSAISKKYYNNPSLYLQIATYNGLEKPYTIRHGDTLKIPPKIWGKSKNAKPETKVTIITIEEALVITPVFEVGVPVVVGSWVADGSLVIDRTDKEVHVSGSMEGYGDGATRTNVATAEATVRKYWNQSFTGGYKVVCNVNINLRAPGASSSNDTKIDIDAGSGVAYVSGLTNNMTLYLKNENGTPSNDLTWAVAHEFGHVIGLDDKYTEGFFSKVMAIIGKDSKRKTAIVPGYQGNIMAQSYGNLESKNIADIDKDNSPYFYQKDDRIRLWVSRHSKEKIAKLNAATKIKMIETLLDGFISEEDLDAIASICKSVASHVEADVIGRAIGIRLTGMTDIRQRTRMRGIISNMP